MLGEQVAALGTVAIEQTLTGEATACKGHFVDSAVVALVDAQGIDGIVKQNANTVLLVRTQIGKDQREANGQRAEGHGEPNHIHTAAKGHADEDKHEDEGNAGVFGHNHVQTNQNTQVQHHMEYRGNAGYSVLVRVHN